MTGHGARRMLAAVVAVVAAVVFGAAGCAIERTSKAMTWDLTEGYETRRMGWEPGDDDLYAAEFDDLRIRLPDDVVIDVGWIGRRAIVSALRTLPSDDPETSVEEMTLEFPRLSLDDARRLAKRMARSYGLDPERFDGGLSGGSVFSGRYLVPPDGLSIEVTIRARSGGDYAVLIGLSWPLPPSSRTHDP